MRMASSLERLSAVWDSLKSSFSYSVKQLSSLAVLPTIKSMLTLNCSEMVINVSIEGSRSPRSYLE